MPGSGGLEEVIAAQTAISDIDGKLGKLWYAVRPTSGSQDANVAVATPCSVFGAGLSPIQIKSYLPICLAKGVK